MMTSGLAAVFGLSAALVKALPPGSPRASRASCLVILWNCSRKSLAKPLASHWRQKNLPRPSCPPSVTTMKRSVPPHHGQGPAHSCPDLCVNVSRLGKKSMRLLMGHPPQLQTSGQPLQSQGVSFCAVFQAEQFVFQLNEAAGRRAVKRVGCPSRPVPL